MELTVLTGATKSNAAISLAPLTFEGRHGEQVCLLLQVHAHPRDAHTVQEESTTIVRHALLESDGESWHRVDGALKELNGLFKGFLASGSVSDIHAVISFVDKEGTLHLSHAGRGEAYLIRHGGASQITEFSKGKPMPMFVHISSGELESGDTVILCTQRLLRTLTPVQLAQAAQRHTQVLDELAAKLEGEREIAALASIHVPNVRPIHTENNPEDAPAAPRARRGSAMRSSGSLLSSGGSMLKSAGASMMPLLKRTAKIGNSAGAKNMFAKVKKHVASIQTDLRHPQRKKRAHLLILAAALALFVILWMLFQLTAASERNKSKAQLQTLVTQVQDSLKIAENKRLLGDIDSANAILARAEDQAKQVMSSDTGLFRSEALTLLDQVRSKKEEIGNVVRVSPRLVVNVGAKSASVAAQGLIGVSDGEFLIYDHQNTYHVLLNTVEDGRPLSEGDSIIRGSMFSRLKAAVFLATGNGLLELQGGQTTVMKTDDTNGWPAGRDIETYLRYLYILSTDGKIYKFERLSNRYGPSVQYNVNADLTGAIDMAIDGAVYVLKENGEVVKLFRGEAQPFTVHRAPDGAMKGLTRVFKVPAGNLYFLDPTKKRVVVVQDATPSGDVSYIRQYVLEGDQVGTPQDIYVDPDETHLYVLDEQRLHVVDLKK